VDPPDLFFDILLPVGAALLVSVGAVFAVGWGAVKIVGGTVRLGKSLFGRGRSTSSGSEAPPPGTRSPT
jgi:hypothetical protein